MKEEDADVSLKKGDAAKKSRNLVLSFVAMIFVGLGNKIFQKLQTIPMRNYPNFLNLFTTFVYIPLSFAYIIPMIKYGRNITLDQRRIPKKNFAIMGGLDSVAGIMQVFGATYLGGSLLILLGQAAIPISMAISRSLLRTKYNLYQYIGATVVMIGLLVVLLPETKTDTWLLQSSSKSNILPWSLVVILSCVPMCLSSVYKEKALGLAELDPVYLNGWIGLFQFIAAIPLAVPAALASQPPVSPSDLPENLWNGLKCYGGVNSITGSANSDYDDHCEMAPLYVSIYLIFNVSYNILIILILKYGSANILWLAMTIMVPLGNVAFTFHFMPDHQPLKSTDVAGLVIIMAGLVTYRFLNDLTNSLNADNDKQSVFRESLLPTSDDEEVHV